MSTRIFGATDLKTRRTELLGAALKGRALVRAVDGTALVLTRLAAVEASDCVATWALRLHRAMSSTPTALPAELEWLDAFDAQDRAECLSELWTALTQVLVEEDRTPFDEAIRGWRTTAEAIADPTRREVLLGAVAAEDFVPAARPE
jgi:hypothetical protein